MFSKKRRNIIDVKEFLKGKNVNYLNKYRDFLKVGAMPDMSRERFAALCVSVKRGNTQEQDCDPIY